MKKLLVILLVLLSATAFSQTKGYLRYDTTVIMKQGGNGELMILNRTRDSSGVLTNIGGGRTAFRPAIVGTDNGISGDGSDVILGGVLDRYTPITTGSFPLTIRNTGNFASLDSAGLRLLNPTSAATSTDSLAQVIHFRVNGRKTVGGAASQPIDFQMGVYGGSGATTAAGRFFLRSRANNGTWVNTLTISSGGVILDPLLLNNAYIGSTSTAVFFGSTALANRVGIDAVAIGNGALQSNIAGGDRNTAVGTLSLNSNTTGIENTAFGYGALENADSTFNTAVGAYALHLNTNGHQNTAIGKNAGLSNTSGAKNSFIGTAAGENSTTADFVTFVGHDAGLQNTTGTDNIGIGWLGWSQNRTGDYNIGLGNSTGRSVFNGHRNIAIGHEAMYLGAETQNDTLDNSIAIGANVITESSNQIVIGNHDHTQVKVRGIASGVGTQFLKYDPTTDEITYDASGGSGSSLFPTTGTGTATGNVVGELDDNDLTINNVGTLTFSDIAAWEMNVSGGIEWDINAAYWLVTGMANESTQDRLIGQTASDGRFGYVTLGTGLSLAAGVLSATGGGITVGTTTLTSGTDTRVPFNDAGVYNEDAGIVYNKTTDKLTVGSTIGIEPGSGTATFTVKSSAGAFTTTYTYDASRNSIWDYRDGAIIRVNGSNVGSWISTGLSVNQGGGSAADFTVRSSSFNPFFFIDVSANTAGFNVAAPHSYLQVAGSFAMGYLGTATGLTASAVHQTIEVTATGQTITLPTAVGITGRVYTVKLTASGTGTVATTSSQTIDGSTTYSLSAQYKYVTVMSNNANWIIIANN